MSFALSGALLGLGAAALYRRRTGREAWALLRGNAAGEGKG